MSGQDLQLNNSINNKTFKEVMQIFLAKDFVDY